MAKHKIPTSVKNNAKKVLKWRNEHPDEINGMTNVGWTRASQLANDEYVSTDIVKRMKSFLARHENNYDEARKKDEYKTEPWKSAAIVSYLGWGGKSAKSWVDKLSIDKESDNMEQKDEHITLNETLEKNEKSDEYTYLYDEPLTPHAVISFDELDRQKKFSELQHAYELALAQFIEMSERIVNGQYPIPYDENYKPIDNRLELLEKLTGEFIQRLYDTTADTVPLEKAAVSDLNVGDIVRWSFPGDSGTGLINSIYTTGSHEYDDDIFDASTTDPVYEVQVLNPNDDGEYRKSDVFVLKRAKQLKKIDKSDIIIKEKSNNYDILTESFNFSLMKDNSGRLLWFGVPTNKFIDSDEDIIPSYAHEEFVKNVTDGKEEYPDLYIWHLKKAIGKTEFLAYDERGFVIAGGTVDPDYEDIIVNIASNMEKDGKVLGMSHGMAPDKTVIKDHVIYPYVSYEFSLLPVEKAANKLTGFATENI